MKLEIFFGSVVNGEYVLNPEPVAVAETSPRGILVSGDSSFLDGLPLETGDESEQQAVLKQLVDRFSSASLVRTRIDT
jgi:hypothetical protein